MSDRPSLSRIGQPRRNVRRQRRLPRLHRTLRPEQAQARQVHRLPETADVLFRHKMDPYGWTDRVRVVLCGTQDPDSPLSLLRGHESTLLRHIHSFTTSKWAGHVKLTLPACCVGKSMCLRRTTTGILRFPLGRDRPGWRQREPIGHDDMCPRGVSSEFSNGYVAFTSCGKIEFPKPADRNVNMMPFTFGNKDSLPPDLQCYYDCIEKCPYPQEELGQTGYLTVHESMVEEGQAQRREGIHIESPGLFSDDPGFYPAEEHPWGLGMFFEPDMYAGGIYMASSVANTSEVWDALVDKGVPGIVDSHGGCKHLRPFLGEGTKLDANELIWMTDCTPHEAVRQKESGYRQFFRVVTSHISHWYADHSTPNPLVRLPDDVTVIHGDKFAQASSRQGAFEV